MRFLKGSKRLKIKWIAYSVECLAMLLAHTVFARCLAFVRTLPECCAHFSFYNLKRSVGVCASVLLMNIAVRCECKRQMIQTAGNNEKYWFSFTWLRSVSVVLSFRLSLCLVITNFVCINSHSHSAFAPFDIRILHLNFVFDIKYA